MTPRRRRVAAEARPPADEAAEQRGTTDEGAAGATEGQDPVTEAAEDAASVASAIEESYVAVRVVEVAMVLPNPNAYLILEEIPPPRRRLSIPIGLAEGTAIGYILRGRPTPKPLTHELFVEVVHRLGGSIGIARVTRYAQGAYYAEIVVLADAGELVFACRPSDAVALALRQATTTPVAVASTLFDQLGTGGSATG
jgi:bifunctional DNase/RNase